MNLLELFNRKNEKSAENELAMALYNQYLSEEDKWEITRVWRSSSTRKGNPVRYENLVKYFTPEKANHVKTVELLGQIFQSRVPLEELNTILAHNDCNLLPLLKKYVISLGYKLSEGPGQYDIFYLESLSMINTSNPQYISNGIFEPEQTRFILNSNPKNQFNDLRMVVDWHQNKILGSWVATTKPGTFYTIYPMNKEGAFKIAYGLHKSIWTIGNHKGDPNHPALIQSGGAVLGYRDFDQNQEYDYKDKLTSGYFGINQHHGWNMPQTEIGKTSAGCLVGRLVPGHFEFMDIIKRDVRYRENRNYLFSTFVFNSKDFLSENVKYCS